MSVKRMSQFERRFTKTEGCWLWKGQQTSNGYGIYNRAVAHRVSYEFYIGPIPDGLHLHHTCHVRLCVNPAHLQPMTQADNNRQSPKSPTLVCPNGHQKQPRRPCVECRREQKRDYKRRVKARG